MKPKFIKGWDVTQQLSLYLSENLGFSKYTIDKHYKNWYRLYEYAEKKGIRTNFKNYENLRRFIVRFFISNSMEIEQNHTLKHSFNILQEFVRDGKVLSTMGTTDFSGKIGQRMYEYISQKHAEHLRTSSLKTYELQLSRFLIFLKSRGIKTVSEISSSDVILYIKQLPVELKSNTYIAISVVKRFLKWLYQKQLIEANISIQIPSGKHVQQPMLPSVYTKEEIECILSSIDRGNAVGKRNYLILILAARLGLRSSDICNLKFENVKWEDNLIMIEQVKTNHSLNLPLLAEVGNAMIDYLHYGRPKSDVQYIILNATHPFGKMKPATIFHVTTNAFRHAKIEIGNRRHGAHSLRHSLAARMLEGQTTMPVVSEVLGHADTNSTMYYLRIDVTSLSVCPLDTLPVTDDFYNQFKWK